jgi:hypothetical protein
MFERVINLSFTRIIELKFTSLDGDKQIQKYEGISNIKSIAQFLYKIVNEVENLQGEMKHNNDKLKEELKRFFQK